jgi:hypothetical protein
MKADSASGYGSEVKGTQDNTIYGEFGDQDRLRMECTGRFMFSPERYSVQCAALGNHGGGGSFTGKMCGTFRWDDGAGKAPARSTGRADERRGGLIFTSGNH